MIRDALWAVVESTAITWRNQMIRELAEMGAEIVAITLFLATGMLWIVLFSTASLPF